MLLVLLQNAWSGWYTRIGRPGEEHHRLKDRVWHRDDWIDATWSCHSGFKLMKILEHVPDDQIWLDNTTLEVANKSSGVCKLDLDHIRGVLRDKKIRAVLACGKQAGSAIDKVWDGPLLKIPHPACRVLTNSTLGDYNIFVRAMLDMIPLYTVWRLEMDTYSMIRELPGHHREELNFGCAWIREGEHQQAEGIARSATGSDTSVLQGERPDATKDRAAV